MIVVMDVIMQSGLQLLDTMEFGEIKEFRFERTDYFRRGRYGSFPELGRHS